MTTARAGLLTRQLDLTWSLFEYYLRDLDDAACLWEPAPDCWTVRPDGRGGWVADWETAEPDPAPATSIGWLTWHIGYWWTTTLAHCFGPGAPAREEITWPGGADAAAEWLRGLKDEWRAALLPLTEAELDSTDRTAGLPWGQETALVDVASWVNFELAKNVAEIGLTQRFHARARTAER